jgi:hypothetical protein
LEKLHPFPNDSDLPPDILEEKYMQLLESNSEYRQHLQIGGTFAYFMDFSKWFFLSYIIGNIHDPPARISQSMAENASIIWDPAAFEAKCGSKNAQIYDRLQDWHATVAIPYKMVAGRRLFEQAARVLLKLQRKIPKVFEELAHLKMQSAHLTSVLDLLNKSVPEISSYKLLKVMFNIVLIHMYQEP